MGQDQPAEGVGGASEGEAGGGEDSYSHNTGADAIRGVPRVPGQHFVCTYDTYLRMYVCVCVHNVCVCVNIMYVCMYVCIMQYVCMYICIRCMYYVSICVCM